MVITITYIGAPRAMKINGYTSSDRTKKKKKTFARTRRPNSEKARIIVPFFPFLVFDTLSLLPKKDNRQQLTYDQKAIIVFFIRNHRGPKYSIFFYEYKYGPDIGLCH